MSSAYSHWFTCTAETIPGHHLRKSSEFTAVVHDKFGHVLHKLGLLW